MPPSPFDNSIVSPSPVSMGEEEEGGCRTEHGSVGLSMLSDWQRASLFRSASSKSYYLEIPRLPPSQFSILAWRET